MTPRQIGSLVWLLLCVIVGFREIYSGLPEVRERVRAGSGTPEDFRRLRKKKFFGWFIIVGLGISMTLSDLIPLIVP
jgi:hypothetical protein